jgi:4'-phosphopantetheinyl transferase
MSLGVLGQNIDVWLIDLDKETLWSEHAIKLLSVGEQERASRFKFENHRRRYMVSHAGLRSILSAYLKIPPKDLLFSAGPRGKPKLTPTMPGTDSFHFNLSHSDEVALIAVTRAGEIGVDIEYVKKDFPIHQVAERFFTPKEVKALKALPDHLQRKAFFQCWTSKEAFLKAKGAGLSGKLDEVEITFACGQRVRIMANIRGWSLAELNACDGYEAALVSEGEPAPIHLYRWKP